MGSLLTASLSFAQAWEFSFYLIGSYLVFFPCLSHPQSMAVVLGGGLALLFLRPITVESAQALGKPAFFFLAYLLMTSLWSLSPGISFQSAGLVFLGILLYTMAKTNNPNVQGRLEIFGFLLAVVAGLIGLYQYFFGFESMKPLLDQVAGAEHEILNAAIYNRRSSGPFDTQGALAAFLILFIPYGFTLWKSRAGTQKIIYGFLTLILLVGLLTTQSVGALAALVAAAALVLAKRKSNRVLGWVVAGGTVGILLLLMARGAQNWLLAALGTRLALWQAAWGLFLAHPLFGSGLGTFDEAYQQAGLPLVTGARYTHNLILQLLVETGITGLILFVAALAGMIRRLKIPSRWEGWGVGTGVLAFLIFSLVDLPFQMPEVVWFFAVVAARLELKPAPALKLPAFPQGCLECGLLIVLLISGFWPPLRQWNFALVAGTLWVLVGGFGRQLEGMPFWVFVGTIYLALRAFFSPSASGTVWFFEITGVALAFYVVLQSLEKPERFIKAFFALGLAWAVKVWWVSFHYAEPGISNWVHFQYSDVKDWMIFPNPKQVGLYLVPLVFFLWKKPIKGISATGILGSLLTMLRLKSFGALLAMGTGILTLLKKRSRVWVGLAAVTLVGGILFLRSLDPSPTRWERFSIWGSALKVWAREPLLGVGPGAFAGYFHQVKFPRTTGVSRYLMDAQYAHNEFLELLTAFGLLGFVFGMALLVQAWKETRNPQRRAGLTGLGAASLVDFCLHTPLIALQGTALLAEEKGRPTKTSPVGAFLALGLAVGLFVPPVFANLLRGQAEAHLAESKPLPQDLWGLENATRLNAWDASFWEARADFQEKLFLQTKDPVWARRSDDDFEKTLDLEQAEGQWKLKKAERLTERVKWDPDPPSFGRAEMAWKEAESALPLNAFAHFEQGLFLLGKKDPGGALAQFTRAGELEPNYAAAWVNEGILLKQEGDSVGARMVFQKALAAYGQWKDVGRIDPLEKQMVYLSPETVSFLRKELGQ